MDKKRFWEKLKHKWNRAHTMQFRFLATVIFAMLSITVFIGAISIYEVDRYIQEESRNFVEVACENEGTQINDALGNMEKSVKIMESYVLRFLTDDVDLKDSVWQEALVDSVGEMFTNVARHTDEAIAYYFRFNPEISHSKAGLFCSKMNGSAEYTALEPTDIALYSKDDTEHVGWFWQPYEAGEPVWMLPYYNRNNNVLMISYVVPVYCKGTFVGVVGMDFDYTILIDRVHEMQIYESGFAHLEADGVVIHSYEPGHDPESYDDSEKYLRVSRDLVNGMTLVLSADYDDIRQIRYKIALHILFADLILSAVFTGVAIVVVRRIVDPLKKLTNASVMLSDGDYNVEFVHSNTHEIELLSTAFETMAMRLHEREKTLHLSANRDSLTGLRNTTSYKSWVTEFEKEIINKNVQFGVVVFDINYLKQANDSYGHETGDKLIVTCAKLISDTFKRSPVFRIGGDEFLAVLQNADLENHEALFKQLDLECANASIEGNSNIPVSIAKGFSGFDPDRDLHFADVFKRADDAMYNNKRTNR